MNTVVDFARRRKAASYRLAIVLAAGIVGSLIFAAVSGHRALSQPGPGAGSGVVFRVGYQGFNGAGILKAQGTLEHDVAKKHATVQWLNFSAGPEMMQAMGTGNVDIGGAGDTVPIFAQASGVPFVYIANSPVTKTGIAVLVRAESPISKVSDLKGRRVALVKGSGSHYFFVQALERAHVNYSDILPVYLTPSDAFAAFASGKIDAWVTWDPYIALAKQKLKSRVLVDQTGIPSNGGFVVASKKLATEHPELIAVYLDDSLKSAEWSKKQPAKAIDLLIKSAGGLSRQTVSAQVQNGSDLQYYPIDPRIIALQQKEADEFYKLGVIGKRVDIRDSLLTRDQYAKIALPRRNLARSEVGS
ncbi:MAG: aliphatic sulfonate ABC transporter substrate-binding protein [Capsulimonadaceae bacterium]|nr:aliphatic sulfonate ABC transporter substrate-binding protein [Capsulimonadaceae bacterium]